MAHVRKFSPAKFSNQHSFLYDDLNNDGNPELFYLDDDSLSAYRFNGKPLFSKKFKYPADPSFNVYTLSANNKKIGINVPEENRIYLFNGDGSIYEGFPLEGNSGFSLRALQKRQPAIQPDCGITGWLFKQLPCKIIL